MELRPWTLPNFLTFARLASLPFLIMAILGGRHGVALVIFLAAAITDIVDGYVARRFGMGSPLGAWLDPIVDKFFLVSTFVVFALPSTPTSLHIPIWLLVLTIFRDALHPRHLPRPVSGARHPRLSPVDPREAHDVPGNLDGRRDSARERAPAAGGRRDDVHAARRGLRDGVRAPLFVAHRDPSARAPRPRARPPRPREAVPASSSGSAAGAPSPVATRMPSVRRDARRRFPAGDAPRRDARDRGRGLRPGARGAVGERDPGSPGRRGACRREGARRCGKDRPTSRRLSPGENGAP